MTLLDAIKSNSAILIELVNAQYLNMSICVRSSGQQSGHQLRCYDVTSKVTGPGGGAAGGRMGHDFCLCNLNYGHFNSLGRKVDICSLDPGTPARSAELRVLQL